MPQVTGPVSQQDEPAGVAGEEEPLTMTKAGPAQSGAATVTRKTAEEQARRDMGVWWGQLH